MTRCGGDLLILFFFLKKNFSIIPCSLESWLRILKLPFPSPFALKEFQMSVSVASAHICDSLSLSFKREKINPADVTS